MLSPVNAALLDKFIRRDMQCADCLLFDAISDRLASGPIDSAVNSLLDSLADSLVDSLVDQQIHQ